MRTINEIMAKEQPSTVPHSVVEINTTVEYQGEKLQSVIRFNVEELAQIVKNKGAEAANKSMKTLTDQIYAKTSENLKQLINK